MTANAFRGPVPLSRRQFLARCGAAGALAALADLPGLSAAAARAQSPAEVGAAMRLLTVDTIAGLVAFVVPGGDRYSLAQGVTSPTPGGVDARAPEGMVELFDRVLPMPDSFVQTLAAAFATGMSDVPVPGLDGVFRRVESGAATLDQAFEAYLANDETVPLSLVVALMLNFVATSVDPAAIAGPIPSSPFSNLAFAAKAEVLRRIEEDHAELAALVDAGAAEPSRGTLSGQIQFLGGALPAAAAVLSYSEWGVLDSARGTATARPLGWDLTSYAPGRVTPADGWNELRGYYQGRRRVRPARRRRRRGRRRRRDA